MGTRGAWTATPVSPQMLSCEPPLHSQLFHSALSLLSFQPVPPVPNPSNPSTHWEAGPRGSSGCPFALFPWVLTSSRISPVLRSSVLLWVSRSHLAKPPGPLPLPSSSLDVASEMHTHCLLPFHLRTADLKGSRGPGGQRRRSPLPPHCPKSPGQTCLPVRGPNPSQLMTSLPLALAKYRGPLLAHPPPLRPLLSLLLQPVACPVLTKASPRQDCVHLAGSKTLPSSPLL